MKRYSDILYWVKYRDMIHYDEKTDTVSYDPDLPERARISYEMWLKQDDQNSKRWQMKAIDQKIAFYYVLKRMQGE